MEGVGFLRRWELGPFYDLVSMIQTCLSAVSIPTLLCLLAFLINIYAHSIIPTVDFDEEFSAFHSGTLSNQAHYVVHAMSYILSLYIQPQPQIYLLGHSMGGIVAKYALVLSTTQYDKEAKDVLSAVPAIITMSSPHLNPPVNFDHGFHRIYSEIETYWNRHANDSETSPMLISICGGSADTQIASDTCSLSPRGDIKDDGYFAVFTSGIEMVWTSVEHQAIVWCDQVRWRVARLLLDMVGVEQGTAKTLRDSRTKLARSWLLGERNLSSTSATRSFLAPSGAATIRKLLPTSPNIVHTNEDTVTYTADVPKASENIRVQLMGRVIVDGVGPSTSASAVLNICKRLIDRAGYSCRNLAPQILRHLPPSPPFDKAEPHQKHYPPAGLGAQLDEGIVYLEAVIDADSSDQLISITFEGIGWASLSFVDGRELKTIGGELSPATPSLNPSLNLINFFPYRCRRMESPAADLYLRHSDRLVPPRP